jgi:methylase of polypeptide subunit release factors
VTVSTGRFGPLQVRWDADVLGPREWTVLQSLRAARRLVGLTPGPIAELHAGAGHIGQATAAWSDRTLVQIDDDPVCCTWAARNAAANGIRSTIVCAGVDALPLRDEQFALVLADPPYVPTGEVCRFPHDPLHAIDGGFDGLDGLRACLPAAARALRVGGVLVLQVRGPRQVAAVRSLLVTVEPQLELSEVAVAARDRAVVELVRR